MQTSKTLLNSCCADTQTKTCSLAASQRACTFITSRSYIRRSKVTVVTTTITKDKVLTNSVVEFVNQRAGKTRVYSLHANS